METGQSQGHALTFLGTGAGPGVPAFFCNCAACREATLRPDYGRTRCALLIRGARNTLIDAPPDLRGQLLREKVEGIDHFILTHGHYDHSGGLGDLEFSCRICQQGPIPAYMSFHTQEWLRGTFGFLEDCFNIKTVNEDHPFDVDGIVYRSLEVAHAPGTLGLLMETEGGRRTAYIPDTGPLPEATLRLIEYVDTLIIGATFWGRNWMPEDHLSVHEAVAIGKEAGARQIYITHLSMHHDVPVTNRELETYLNTFGDSFHLAYDRLCISI